MTINPCLLTQPILLTIYIILSQLKPLLPATVSQPLKQATRHTIIPLVYKQQPTAVPLAKQAFKAIPQRCSDTPAMQPLSPAQRDNGIDRNIIIPDNVFATGELHLGLWGGASKNAPYGKLVLSNFDGNFKPKNEFLRI